MAEALSVVSVMGKTIPVCFEVIDKVKTCIEIAKENDETCHHIVCQMEVLSSTLSDLSRAKTMTDSVAAAIRNLELKLKKCEEYIDHMNDFKMCRPRDFINSKNIREDLRKLKKEVEDSVQVLTLSVSVQMLLQLQDVEIKPSTSVTGGIPSQPQQPKVDKRDSNRLRMTWQMQLTEQADIGYFEVQYRKRWQSRWISSRTDSATVTQHIITGLSSNSKYWLRVRAINIRGYPGRFSDEVYYETKYNAVARGLMCTGVFLVGTVGAPILSVAGAGLSVIDVSSKGENTFIKLGKAASITAAVPILSTIGAPVMGGAVAYAVNDELKPDDF